MRPSEAGLVVSGEVDRPTDEGQMVWRTIKSGTAGFPIGYSGTYLPRENGGRVLVKVDLLEISATSTPMHPATRALSWKCEDASIREAMRAILTEAVSETKAIEPLKIATFEC